jgi:hypothetical protein
MASHEPLATLAVGARRSATPDRPGLARGAQESRLGDVVRSLSIIAVVTIDLLIGLRFIWLLRRHRISPALAMWVFFTIAVVGSLLTYLAAGDYDLWDNILNTADLLLCASISIAILIHGDRSTRFNRFDLGCLAVVLAILVVWIATRQHAGAHIAIQAIMTIAYFPVVRRLWVTNRNTESFLVWTGVMVAPLFSLLSSKGALATVYAVRASASSALLLLLMLRAERRQRAAARSIASRPTV